MGREGNPNNEIGFDELINNAKAWIRYFWSKWFVISGLAILGGTSGYFISLLLDHQYEAEMTFALEEKGGANAYAGIASQFGIELGSEGGAFSGDNCLALIKSRFLVEKSLLTPVMVEGKEELLINRYKDFDPKCRKWENDERLAAIKFVKGEPRSSFSITKDSLVKQISRAIIKKNLLVDKIDRKTDIIYVKCTIKDELFAKYFVETLVKNASDFYIETKTKKSKINVLLLEGRVDSVKRELDNEIYGAAVTRDQNTNNTRALGGVQSVKKQMNVQVLTTMYGELVKNLELSKFALMREEPLFQIIDRPILPLDDKKLRKRMGALMGVIAGVIISLIYLGAIRRSGKKSAAI